MDFEKLAKQYHAYVVTIVYNILHGYLNEIDMQAVVNQTISGLACGRPIRGKVAFLGGPLTYLPELRNRFINKNT